jgi:hypothetical protein
MSFAPVQGPNAEELVQRNEEEISFTAGFSDQGDPRSLDRVRQGGITAGLINV